MTPARMLAGLAAAAITGAIALTPAASSDARDTGGHKRPDIGARHGAGRSGRPPPPCSVALPLAPCGAAQPSHRGKGVAGGSAARGHPSTNCFGFASESDANPAQFA